MIQFTKKDDNKQYVSIMVTPENTNTNSLINKIKSEYPSIQALHIIFDESEILIPVENSCNYGFSLNELREYIQPIAAATVSHFAVDTDVPGQREY